MNNIFLQSDNGKFSGYASIFNVPDGYGDIILPHAFKKSLKKRGGTIKLLWQHIPENPIGVIEKIYENEVGLYIEAKLLLEVSKGNEAYHFIKSGAVSGLSIGYNVIKSKHDGQNRLLQEIDVWEVSIVTFPANHLSIIQSVKNNGELQELDLSIERAINSLR